MTRPRKELISLDDTPYYHCVSRCVRRAFLCGCDGEFNFEHRRGWIVERIKTLASVFTIDIAAYAIMSNHYHLVLRVNTELAQGWSISEVIARWTQLYKPPLLISRYQLNPNLSRAELEVVEEIVNTWRQRLMDISWFMRCLNEPIARMANTEDKCTGRFWEGRFKSQALLDETAVLSCMAYVDLNPIRAAMADCPENSDYTSIQERLGIEPAINSVKEEISNKAILLPFAGDAHWRNHAEHIPFHFADYLELVDWTGRILRDDKRGAISANLPPILQRLHIQPERWLRNCKHLEQDFHRAIGPIAKLEQLCEKLNQRWLHGQSACRQMYAVTA
jgi:REP element-mobilizing transposase RayT